MDTGFRKRSCENNKLELDPSRIIHGDSKGPGAGPGQRGLERRYRRGTSAWSCTGRRSTIREAEQRAFDLFLQNLVKGTSHLSLGQEAVAAGFAGAMKKGDL